MPWFPDFVSAVELARRQTRDQGQADPIGQYLTALSDGDAHVLETAWPGHLVVYDPRAGEISGHRQLRHFIRGNQAWMAEHHARTETVAATHSGDRAVLELLGHLIVDGQQVAWPVAVVAESHDDQSVVFRTYCSQWPVDGRRHLRPPVLPAGSGRPGDVVGRYWQALEGRRCGRDRGRLRPRRVLPRTDRAPHHAPRPGRAALVLHPLFQCRGRDQLAGLPGDRRRDPVRGGVQLRPLGRP